MGKVGREYLLPYPGPSLINPRVSENSSPAPPDTAATLFQAAIRNSGNPVNQLQTTHTRLDWRRADMFLYILPFSYLKCPRRIPIMMPRVCSRLPGPGAHTFHPAQHPFLERDQGRPVPDRSGFAGQVEKRPLGWFSAGAGAPTWRATAPRLILYNIKLGLRLRKLYFP